MNKQKRRAAATLVLFHSILATSGILAQDAGPTVSLPAQLDWVKFKITNGCITAVNSRPGKQQELTTTDPLTAVSQRFSIEYLAGRTLTHLRFSTPRKELSILFNGPRRMTITLKGCGTSDREPIRWTQSPSGKQLLSMGGDPPRRQITADSFWHLMLFAEDSERKQIEAILETLRPAWGVAKSVQKIESELARLWQSGQLLTPRQSEELIRRLGSPRFSQRQAAQRQLLQLGPAAMAIVRRMNQTRLSAEQKLRIQHISRAMTTDTDDTPARVAASLAEDKTVWLILLAHAEQSHRQAAAERLTALLGRRLEFDPQARQEMRRTQIEQLRQQLANN